MFSVLIPANTPTEIVAADTSSDHRSVLLCNNSDTTMYFSANLSNEALDETNGIPLLPAERVVIEDSEFVKSGSNRIVAMHAGTGTKDIRGEVYNG